MMGLRADITPQVARIDARNMHRNGPARLCYADSVVHTRPRGLLTSRVPIRIGAELFGSASVSADVELIVLMSRTLSQAGIGPQHIVLGHVGLFRGLVAAAELEAEQEAELFDAVQRKAFADIDIWLDEQVENINLARMLKALCRLSGDITVLDEAEQVLAHAPPQVRLALDELRKTAEAVQKRLPDHSLGFDLSELRGYQYHTGTVFAAYTPGYGRAVAKGGRYDEIGQAYGRARPASGFDADLKILARLSSLEVRRPASILAPDEDDAALQTMVEDLRRQGEVVITHLDEGEADAALLKELNCDRRIVAAPEGGWQLVTI